MTIFSARLRSCLSTLHSRESGSPLMIVLFACVDSTVGDASLQQIGKYAMDPHGLISIACAPRSLRGADRAS